jgi:hypothetical protein
MVPSTVASTMPMAATRSVLTTPTIGILGAVGEPGIGNRHPGLATEKGKSGRDATHRKIVNGVRPKPGDDRDRDPHHHDLPEKSGKAFVAQ